jgi:hypothetical protein
MGRTQAEARLLGRAGGRTATDGLGNERTRRSGLPRSTSGTFLPAQMPHTVSACGSSSSPSSSPWSGSCSPSSSASSSLVLMGSGYFNLVRPSRERSPVNSTAVESFRFARGADQIAWGGNVEYNPESEKFETASRSQRAQTWPKRSETARLDHAVAVEQPLELSHFPPRPANPRQPPANPVEVQVLSSALRVHGWCRAP